MLQKSGLYSLKNDTITIRLPNPNDFIYKWNQVSPSFKKDFVSAWHDVFVLSQQPSTPKVYGIPLLAYKQLLILDHIGYLINSNNPPTSSFETCYKNVLEEYGSLLDMIAISNHSKH